ncbi:MAG: hypothetical protein LBH32_05900 [Dysgonamonadaceae bacterium]|jgi:hypothetical protein|nr:hypothetical protein [Dysgonamonadaceae bacterium]
MKEKVIIKRTTVRKTQKWNSLNEEEKTSNENGLMSDGERKLASRSEASKHYENWFDK